MRARVGMGIGMVAMMLASGCASPIAPAADPMATWAAAHAHEVCVLATRFEDGRYIDYGVLVPIATWNSYPTSVRTMPISYCNPDE